jgi:stage II sporulation protein E
MKVLRIRYFIVYLIGFVIARAVFFQMDPLAIGFFTAAYLERAGGGLLFLAVLTGICSALPLTTALKYLLTLVASVIILEAPFLKNRNVPKQSLYFLPPVILGIFSTIEAASTGWSWDYIALAVLEAVIAYISGMIFGSGTGFLLHENKDYRISNEQMVSLAFIVAVFLYAVPEFGGPNVAPVETAVYFIILFFTYKYGVGQGTVAGAVSGFAMNLRGGAASGIGLYTMMGVVTSAFRELGRIPTAAIFAVTASLGGLIFDEMAMSVREAGALASAILLFLLLPPGMVYRLDSEEGAEGRETLASLNLKKIANTRMKIFSDSFLKLSRTLESITDQQTKLKQQEINYIFEEISEKLCRNCVNCGRCWENNFQATYQSACTMFEVAEKNGFIRKEDIPVPFLEACISADQFLAETNRGFEIAKLNHIWSSKIAESREVFADQLKEVSECIQNITGDIYGTAQTLRAEEELVRRKLKGGHVLVKSIAIIERGDKRKEIYLNASAGRGKCITAKESAALIGEALGVRVRVADSSKTVLSRDYENFIFMEDTKFKVLTGVARAMKDNVSGDNFSLLKLESGEYMIALSDGMGTGKEAGQESETVMALLEQLIEAGFKTETAIKLINSSLVLKSDKQSFSTIDMGIINLFTGMCEFTKIGAAAAFIKRDKWVETISSTTLPIGMFGNVDYDAVTKKLYEGDIIIMVTDGVLDSIREENKEAYMERMIAELKSNNPQEIANRILDHTLAQSNYVPMDDMTVITAGIWLK